MSIIPDTSVWSRFLRRGVPSQDPQRRRLESLIEQGRPIVVLGAIIQEVLQGIRDPASFERLRVYLADFPMLELCREDYIAAARLVNTCRSRGIQVSTVDAQIAAACIEHDCDLLTCDQDFQYIATVSPLRLL